MSCRVEETAAKDWWVTRAAAVWGRLPVVPACGPSPWASVRRFGGFRYVNVPWVCTVERQRVTQRMTLPPLTELEEEVRDVANEYRRDYPAVAGYLDGVADDVREARDMVVEGNDG